MGTGVAQEGERLQYTVGSASELLLVCVFLICKLLWIIYKYIIYFKGVIDEAEVHFVRLPSHVII